MTDEEMKLLQQIVEQNMALIDMNWLIVRSIVGEEPDDELMVTMQ